MRHFNLCRMRMEMIVDPAGEDRCLHRHRPGLRQSSHPDVQLAARCPKLAFLVNSTTRILDAIADRLLVNIQTVSNTKADHAIKLGALVGLTGQIL